MEQKLQELTDTLFAEGVQKGEEKARAIIREAEEKAARLLLEARASAEAVMAGARKEAEEFKSKSESELKRASLQALTRVRQSVEEAVFAKAVDAKLKEAVTDPGFIRDAVKTMLAKWDAASGIPALEIVLPETERKSLEGFFAAEMKKALSSGMTLRFSDGIRAGFQIVSKESGFRLSFTDADFSEFFRQYLKPQTRKLLFNE